MDYVDLWRCAEQIPLEWIEHDGEGLFRLKRFITGGQ